VLKSSYDFTQPHCAQIWEYTANETGCAEAVRKAEKSGCPFLAVHRKAIGKMDGRGQTIVARFWHTHGLFPSVNDAACSFANSRKPIRAARDDQLKNRRVSGAV
jgi:hypothetical protein